MYPPVYFVSWVRVVEKVLNGVSFWRNCGAVSSVRPSSERSAIWRKSPMISYKKTRWFTEFLDFLDAIFTNRKGTRKPHDM